MDLLQTLAIVITTRSARGTRGQGAIFAECAMYKEAVWQKEQ